MLTKPACLANVPVLAVLFSLAACSAVGPDYVAPKLAESSDVPARWTSPGDTVSLPGAGDEARIPPAPWWSELADSALDRLVSEAIRSSPTLEAAIAKLKRTRSALGQADAAALPAADAAAGRQWGEASMPYTDSWLSVNSSWEIDLFGAVRRTKEGAEARAAAQQASLADTRVSLAADVTDAYLSYRACQSRVALSEQDLASRQATQKLTAASVEVGFTAPYQGIRSVASVAETRTRLAATNAQCERLENLLTRLTGIPRPKLMEILVDKPTGLDRLPVPRHFSIAIPSETLMQRPDIRSAERLLAAASADIGLAEADRYPRLSLTGSFGYSVAETGENGALSLGTWSFGPALSLPVFDGGRRAKTVEMAKARFDEALADFKSVTRKAIQEVEDALTRYAAAHERAESARLSASEYQRFFAAVEARYREGASNLLELEDARRAMLGAQQTLLGVRLERLQAWVALNRATGGVAQFGPGQPGIPNAPTVETFPVRYALP